MDLSTVDHLGVSPQTEHRVLITWASRQHASNFTVIADDGGYVNADDVVWRLLSYGAKIEQIRPAFATYPAFSKRTARPTSGGSFVA